MQRAIRCIVATFSIASLAVLLIFAVSSRTVWGGPSDTATILRGDAKATGSLVVKIKPQEAKQAGGRWRVDGGAWRKSGRTVSGLSVGQHTVTFKTIAGWVTPKQKVPSITANQTTSVNGKYIGPAVAPIAAFSATPTGGAAPLDVQFTDESIPGSSPITSWAWDFENDGVVDSTQQHPAHIYSTVGDFDVILTVSSSSGSDALTKQAFIYTTVAGPTVSFSATPTSGAAPLQVQFTDESVPGTSPITSWAWDFDNDGTVDSTEQNPQPTYQDGGLYDVKLTVGSASGPGSLIKYDYIIVESENYDVIILPGDVPLELVWIPAGSFMMGRYTNEQGSASDESPQHQVTFANGFWMGKYEVTQAQWVAVMGSNPSHFTGDLSRPVEQVSWNTVQTFISAVNALGQGTVHLPTEAQWEYACRAGTTTWFYWGDDPSYTQIGNYAWYFGNGGSTTHPVGQKIANSFGLFDMSGNVWEYCEDWYHADYTGAPTDGSAWVSPTAKARVGRGGAVGDVGRYCRSANRNFFAPLTAIDPVVGFRLAR